MEESLEAFAKPTFVLTERATLKYLARKSSKFVTA